MSGGGIDRLLQVDSHTELHESGVIVISHLATMSRHGLCSGNPAHIPLVIPITGNCRITPITLAKFLTYIPAFILRSGFSGQRQHTADSVKLLCSTCTLSMVNRDSIVVVVGLVQTVSHVHACDIGKICYLVRIDMHVQTSCGKK